MLLEPPIYSISGVGVGGSYSIGDLQLVIFSVGGVHIFHCLLEPELCVVLHEAHEVRQVAWGAAGVAERCALAPLVRHCQMQHQLQQHTFVLSELWLHC